MSSFRCLVTGIVFSITMTTVMANLHTSKGPAHPPATYKVLKTMKLGGDGGWDTLTVDSGGRRVYISRGTHVMVVDADTAAVVGDIPGTNGVHGIAVAPSLGRGFTSNGRDNTVSVFDLKTLKVTQVIPTGKNPDIIIYDADSKLIFTGNGGSHDITVIDARTQSVNGTIPLDGKPEFAVTDKGHIYVNLEDKSVIARINLKTMSVDARWPLAPCEEPTGLAIDKKSHRLFSACDNKMMAVVNLDTGQVVTTIPTGNGADGAEFDSSNGNAFSPNGADGTLSVVHEDSPDKFTVVQTLTTQRGARTMALDPKTHNIYLVTAEFGPPPAATAERPHPRPSIVPGSFTLLVVGAN